MEPDYFRLLAAPVLIAALPAQALDLGERTSVGGMLAAAGQCQSVSARLLDGTTWKTFGDECRGGMPIQFEISHRPDDANKFFVKLGFATSKGLGGKSPWKLMPWAADLEDDVENINGRSRDYLLTAWYKYTHAFSDRDTLGATIGIIDATDYIDGNEYANDEFTQFMNEVFVNANNYNLGSYDAGAVLAWKQGDWTLTGLGMNIGQNDQGDNYNFWGAEIGYHPQTALGAGNYRLIVTGTSSEFPDTANAKKESLLSYGLSFDQAFGEVLGGFLRVSLQQEDAAVDYKALYSAGLNFDGGGWNRDGDNIGIGYAYLDGGNQSVKSSQVVEAYYLAVLNEHLALTTDVQYMTDDITEQDTRQNNPEGWIVGMRLTAEF